MANGDYSGLTDRELLIVITRDMRDIRRDLEAYRSALANYTPTRELELARAALDSRLKLVERLAYGLVGVVLVAVLTALVGLVILPGVGG